MSQHAQYARGSLEYQRLMLRIVSIPLHVELLVIFVQVLLLVIWTWRIGFLAWIQVGHINVEITYVFPSQSFLHLDLHNLLDWLERFELAWKIPLVVVHFLLSLPSQVHASLSILDPDLENH